MQTKNSGRVVKDEQAKAKSALLQQEMQTQAQFFTLRAQLLVAWVGNSGVMHDTAKSPVDLYHTAHILARKDFLWRCEEARDMMSALGEEMRMPKLYDLLKKESGEL